MKRSSGLKIDLGRVGRSFNAGLTMERFTIDLSLPNFITIGLIALLWYGVVVGFHLDKRRQGVRSVNRIINLSLLTPSNMVAIGAVVVFWGCVVYALDYAFDGAEKAS